MPRSTNVVASQAASGNLNTDNRLTDWSGGRVSVPAVMQEAQVPINMLIKSVNIDTSGSSLRKMRGFTKWWATSFTTDITGIWYDITTTNIYVAAGGNIYTVTQGQTRTSLVSGLDNTNPFNFTRLGDYVLAASTLNPVKAYNTTTSTMSNITTPPALWVAGNYPTAITTWMGRAFAFQKNSDILYYSKLRDPMVWTAGTAATSGGAIVIGSDGAPIKAVIPFSNGLLVFKDPGFYYVSGDTTYSTTNVDAEFDQRTFTWDLVNPNVDAVSQKAVIAVNQKVYAWGREAVWELAVSSNSYVPVNAINIAEAILPEVKSVQTNHDWVSAVHYADRSQIWWGVANNNSATIDTVHCYNYGSIASQEENGAWLLRTGYSHKTMASVRLNNKVSILSGGYAASPYLFLQNSGVNWDTAAMEYYAWLAWVPLGVGARGKPNFLKLYLGTGSNATVNYSYAYDFKVGAYDALNLTPSAPTSTWNTTGSSTWGTGGGTTGTWNTGSSVILKTRLFGKGSVLQHRFYNKELNADLDIIAIVNNNITVGYA